MFVMWIILFVIQLKTASAISVGERLSYLERRMDSFEEPGWMLADPSEDRSAWRKCGQGPCECSERYRKVDCCGAFNGVGLSLDQVVPTDVEYIDLSRNEVPTIGTSVFQRLRKLRELNMFDMNLEHMPKYALRDLTGLEQLKVGRNKISKLDRRLFGTLVELRHLDFSLNSVENLPEDLFRENESLETISFAHNRLTELPDMIFANLQNVTVLDLSNNNLTEIQGQLSPLSGLISLDMSRNRLVNISHLQDCISLETLDLSFNQIASLPPMDDLENLLEVNLKNNRFKVYDPMLFPPSVERLSLSYNDIHAIVAPPGAGAGALRSRLESLDLSANMLETLEAGQLSANWSPRLQVVNLSNNILWKMSAKELPADLREIYLDLNQLPFIEHFHRITQLAKLKKISLGSNFWECQCSKLKSVMFRWISENYEFLIDADEALCEDPEEHRGKKVVEMATICSIQMF